MAPTIGIGTSFNGFTVTEINTTNIVLVNGSKKIVLSFSETERFFNV